jgi:hypothetical protein
MFQCGDMPDHFTFSAACYVTIFTTIFFGEIGEIIHFHFISNFTGFVFQCGGMPDEFAFSATCYVTQFTSIFFGEIGEIIHLQYGNKIFHRISPKLIFIFFKKVCHNKLFFLILQM